MWGYLFVVGAWLTITPPPQVFTDTTSVIMVEFSENMSMDGLRDVDNYSIMDENNHYWTIYRVGIINELDGVIIPDTSLVALVTERLAYKGLYRIMVENVKDKAGNVIEDMNYDYYYFQGFAPNKVGTPTVDLDK